MTGKDKLQNVDKQKLLMDFDAKVKDKEEFAAKSIEILSKEGYIKPGDLVGFIGGVFGAQVGATYMELKYV